MVNTMNERINKICLQLDIDMYMNQERRNILKLELEDLIEKRENYRNIVNSKKEEK